MLTNP